MEFASFRQFLNAFGEKKRESKQMNIHDDLYLEQKLRHDRKRKMGQSRRKKEKKRLTNQILEYIINKEV